MSDTKPKAAQQPSAPAQNAPQAPAPDTSGTPPMQAPARQATAKARASAPVPTHYLVLHGAVGQWPQDSIITAEELKDIDIDRLLRLGAIQPTQEPIKDVPPAAEADDN